MNKISSIVLTVAAFVVLFGTTTTLAAPAPISTVIWGDGTVKQNQWGHEHVTTTLNVPQQNMSVTIVPVDTDNAMYKNVTVTVNGNQVCVFKSKQLNAQQTCSLGRLATGDVVDTDINFMAKKQGLDEWNYHVVINGWDIVYGFAITILPRK